MTTASNQFRNTFKISKDIINWYPGHMKHSFTHMQAKMRIVDCIIEVHDSRIPFSGRNPLFLKSLVGSRPHILVLTKVDLMDASLCDSIVEKYKEAEQNHVLFVNTLNQNCKSLKKIVPLSLNLIKKSNRPPRAHDLQYKMMVVGIPNVGKSSLINALRNTILHKGKATAVGACAGVTRNVQNEIKVSLDPLMYLIDTPGILLPNVLDIETGMKLALCSCLKDDLVGVTTIADFLLYWMNKNENFNYVKYFDCEEATDKIIPLLIKIATDLKKMKKVKNVVNNTIEIIPDINFAANHMIKLYRKGAFGDLKLDCAYL